MNIALRRDWTVPEYLAWAEAQSERRRTELIDGQIVEMSPERVEHNLIKGRVFLALHGAVAAAGIQAQVFTDGMAVPVGPGTAYEPDASVCIGVALAQDHMVVPDPVLVVEVLSPSTASVDRGVKLTGYFSLPSVRHYLVVDPATTCVLHHHSKADGPIEIRSHTRGTLRLDPPGLDVSIDAIFAGADG